jgi:MFS transporter, DHA3 family, macrolide efflux protein
MPATHRASRSRLVTFYALLLTQTFSLIGSRMTAVAIGIWVFRETGQTAPLLLIAFFTELPGMAGGSLAGVLVDRWDRKRVLILADLGQAAGSLLLILSFTSGAFQLWHLYAVAFLQGVFATLQGPAESATVTLLIPEGHRERANALLELGFSLAGILAPVLTGFIYALLGVTGVLVVDLLTFAAAAGVIAVLGIPRPVVTIEEMSGQGKFLAELRAGARFLSHRRPLLVFIVYLAFINFMLNGPLELAIPYLILITGSEAQMGIGMGMMSLGAFIGGLLIAVIGGYRPRMRLILFCTLLYGTMFLALGTARTLPMLAGALFLLLMPLAASGPLLKSLFQVKVPPDLQGRVFGLQSQLDLFASTTSFLLTGLLVDRVLEPAVGTRAWQPFAWLVGAVPGSGIGLLEVFTGVVILAVTALVFSLPAVRHLERDLPDYEPATEDA